MIRVIAVPIARSSSEISDGAVVLNLNLAAGFLDDSFYDLALRTDQAADFHGPYANSDHPPQHYLLVRDEAEGVALAHDASA
jgi:hypothetical protein